MKNQVTSKTGIELASTMPTARALMDLRIKHSRIRQVMDELSCLIYPDSQESILMVCGPTGVGKSTLAKHLVTDENRQSVSQMEANAGIIPAVYVEAPASGEENFSWRLFYSRVLAQLESDINLPKYHYNIEPHSGRMVSSSNPRDRSLAALRMAVERALLHRKTRFLVIDEAAHIIRQVRRNRMEIQLDTLKSLANQAGVQIVLVGSYDLFQLMSLSAQLARRTHVLHMERYREDCLADERAFHACVQKFQETGTQLWGNQLMPYAKALHENTMGCVGTLCSVLSRAANLAEKNGGWSEDCLSRALLTDAQKKRILDEILDGEMAINPGLTREMWRGVNSTKVQKKVA